MCAQEVVVLSLLRYYTDNTHTPVACQGIKMSKLGSNFIKNVSL